jgi:hypothetical protein
VRSTLLVDMWRIDAVSDQCRLVLDRLVDDGVQPSLYEAFPAPEARRRSVVTLINMIHD